MIKLTVNIGGSVAKPKGEEFDYEIPGRTALGEAVAAAKLLHPNWSSIVAVLTRPKAEAVTGLEPVVSGVVSPGRSGGNT